MQPQQHEEKEEQQSLLGPLCPGQKKLLGKTFYLDSVKKRSTAVLLETITFLGGVRYELFTCYFLGYTNLKCMIRPTVLM